MSIVKSFSVGDGDMFYILHNSSNFTIIDYLCAYDGKSATKAGAGEIPRVHFIGTEDKSYGNGNKPTGRGWGYVLHSS